MMKSQLSQYLCLMNEIKLLQKETDAAKEEFEDACKEVRKVSDTVQGSSTDWPYCLHTMTIEGASADVRKNRTRARKGAASAISRLWDRKAACVEELDRLTAYIDSIGDSEVRQILTLRYIVGCNGKAMPWADVAAHMGPYATADSVRKIHDRFLGGK